MPDNTCSCQCSRQLPVWPAQHTVFPWSCWHPDVDRQRCHPPAALLSCRIQRDVAVRGRDVAGVIEQYTKFVKPAFDQYVAPSRKFADIIIPWHRCNEA